MAKKLNFNSWVDQFRGSAAPGSLASVWENKRGRMTRVSVEKRTLAYGLPPGTGTHAWDMYLAHSDPASVT